MLGFYAYVIQKASQAILYSATDRQARTSARLLSVAAVNIAARHLTYGNTDKYNVSNYPISGGIVSWTSSSSDGFTSTANVSGVGIFGPDTVTQYATLQKVSPGWGQVPRWNITSMYASTPVLKDMPYRITR